MAATCAVAGRVCSAAAAAHAERLRGLVTLARVVCHTVVPSCTSMRMWISVPVECDPWMAVTTAVGRKRVTVMTHHSKCND
jgi:hypothetical protein